MRFLHTADLHLGAQPDRDKPWGPARQDAVRTSLMRIIDFCVQENIDLLLIAGDLFDAPPTRQELKEAAFLFGTLVHTKVVLIAGNHDFVRPGSAYAGFRFPDHVHFLSGSELQSVHFPQWNLEVYGLSFDAREIPEDRLSRLTPPADGRRHILLAHGGDDKHLPFRSSQLRSRGWDYVAMGHLHRPAISPDCRLAFPGSPEALDRTEVGEHGFYLGEMRPGVFSVNWQRFSDFRYTQLTLNLTPDSSMASLETLLRKRIGDETDEVYSITLSGRRDPDFLPDTDALARLPQVACVEDQSLPDYPFDKWKERPDHDLLARFVKELSAEEEDEALAALRKKALYCGLEALLAGRKNSGKGGIK